MEGAGEVGQAASTSDSTPKKEERPREVKSAAALPAHVARAGSKKRDGSSGTPRAVEAPPVTATKKEQPDANGVVREPLQRKKSAAALVQIPGFLLRTSRFPVFVCAPRPALVRSNPDYKALVLGIFSTACTS